MHEGSATFRVSNDISHLGGRIEATCCRTFAKCLALFVELTAALRHGRTLKIEKYAWDQSEKFVSIYVDFPGVGRPDRHASRVLLLCADPSLLGGFPSESIETRFEETSFTLSVTPPDRGERHELAIPNLCHATQCSKCKLTMKPDRFVVKLKKEQVGQEWDALDDTARKKKEERDRRVQHGDLKGASTAALIQDMYENADDEQKASLRAAMAKGEKARADAARRGAGA